MLYARNKNNMCNIAYRTFYPIVAKEKNITSTTSTTSTARTNSAPGSLLFNLTSHTDTILSIATLPNGNLASGSWDKTVKIWNPNTGSLVYTLTGHTNGVFTLAIFPNGNLASGSYDFTIKIWNPNTGALVYTLNTLGYIHFLVTLANGNLASSSYKRVYIWNTSTGSFVMES